MKYRTLGKTGKKISLLSFGCMRLPNDEQQAAELISRAVDYGINYFETSPDYCNGTSERKVSLGISGKRDKVYISTKSTVNPGITGDNTKRSVENSLTALGVDKTDFYQFWGLTWDQFKYAAVKGGPLDIVRKFQSQGIIDHVGFTSHDSTENVIELMKTGEFESITIHYHILNTKKEKAIEYANKHGIGIVIMCPIAGGMLARPSERIRSIIPSNAKSSSSAELALRFVFSNPNLTTAASGMENFSDLQKNVETVQNFRSLTTAERKKILKVLDEYQKLGDEFCTGCSYCMPCPNGVEIRQIFKLVNYEKIYGMHHVAVDAYNKIPPEHRADACTECGECEPKCPYKIPIIAQLKEATKLLSS